MLKRLGPRALASLAGTGRGCAAVVAATALMQWAKRWRMTAPGYHGRLCVRRACSYAARCGNREVLEWLHNTSCPWDVSTCWMAAMGGYLEVLRWLRERGCPWDTATCAQAAGHGHLRVLRWAREHQFPWNWATPANPAALGGHLEVLQWTREQDYPWDSATCGGAAHGGHLEVLQWVRENDATGNVWSERLVNGPRKQEVLTWLDALSAP